MQKLFQKNKIKFKIISSTDKGFNTKKKSFEKDYFK